MKQMAADNGRTNDEIHQCIGQNIENRTCRTDPKHKLLTLEASHFLAWSKTLCPHYPRESPYRRYRKSDSAKSDVSTPSAGRQKSTGDQNRKNITKIRRSRHLDIFNHISIGFTAFKNTLFQNQQIFFQ